ncbi:MAG: lipoyl synthase [Magnetococcus sp. YQC-3]
MAKNGGGSPLAGAGQNSGTLARKPDWLKVAGFRSAEYLAVGGLLQRQGLQTVCTLAICPNRGRCWEEGTAAFMILGGVCTRRCGFCAVPTGRPEPVDVEEPQRLLEAVRELGLRHVVITSVDRDDLADGGAAHFAACIRAIREGVGEAVAVEVLVPDFLGKEGALPVVLAAKPAVFNHNMETVARLYPLVRPAAHYEVSLALLAQASRLGGVGMRVKSGIMLGLGESRAEVSELLAAMRGVGVELLTMGQYLQPSRLQHPVVRFLRPEEFVELREEALGLGFVAVESHPLARSSFHARQLAG